MLGITTTNARVGGFRGGILAEAKTIYNRIIADGGVSNLTRLNFFVKGLKAIYGDLANVPVCYDAHWIGYKLGSGTGATAGQAAAKLYSLTVAGDAVQATAASQPLLLAHNGVDNYWYGSGVTGNYCSTPNAASNTLIDNFGIEAFVESYSFSGTKIIIGKYTGGPSTSQFLFRFNGSNLQLIIDKLLVEVAYISTATVPFSINQSFYVRFSRNSTSGDIKFFTSADGITYTQLGTTVSGLTGSLNSPNTILEIGSIVSGTLQNFTGKIKNVKLFKDDTFTTVTQNFNPATYNAATSQTDWTSATGEVWTINTGTASTGYKGVLVDRTIVMSDGVDDVIENTTITRTNNTSQYISFSYHAGSVGGTPQLIDASTAQYRNSFFIDTNSLLGSWVNAAADVFYTTGVALKNIRYLGTVITEAGVSNYVKRNNANQGAANAYTPTPSGTGVRIFAKGGILGAYMNCTLNTYVNTNVNDSVARQTATYNLIRSLNNNAF